MLKWLVTRGPTPPNSLITEDPLATINRKLNKNEPIYSVSRVNPIYEDEISCRQESSLKNTKSKDKKNQRDLLESPPTDHGSIRSSGYCSKEADSVSYLSDPQEDENTEGMDEKRFASKNLRISETANFISSNAGTVAALRKSFENLSSEGQLQLSLNGLDIIQQNPKFVKSIDILTRRNFFLESIPEDSNEIEKDGIYFQRSYWPRVSHLAETLQKQAEEIMERKEEEKQIQTSQSRHFNRIQNLRFNPLVSVVAQDGRYVAAISVSPGKQVSQNRIPSHDSSGSFKTKDNLDVVEDVPFCSRGNHSLCSNAEFPLLSLQPDSLVNEETLRMMNFPEYDSKVLRHEESAFQDVMSAEDMPVFGKALYSGMNSTLKIKPANITQRPKSHPATVKRIACSSKHSAKKKGIDAVKDLWEKSGLKTNGRKLLVDLNDGNQISDDSSKLGTFQCFHSVPSNIDANVHQYETFSTSSSAQSLYYCSIPPCDTFNNSHGCSNALHGIDNPSFIDDRSPSNAPKPMPNFQHNLTDFQKRLTERLKDNQKQTPSVLPYEGSQSGGTIFSLSKIKWGKSCTYPGKAVMEFGLSEEAWKRGKVKEKRNQPTSSNHSDWKVIDDQESQNYGRINREQVWNTLYPKPRSKKSRNYYIPPHPNSGAPFCKPVGACQDFTLDAHNIHHLMAMTTKKKKRRRCCSFFIVLMAFFSFIGMIVGISYFYTGGEKFFGPM